MVLERILISQIINSMRNILIKCLYWNHDRNISSLDNRNWGRDNDHWHLRVIREGALLVDIRLISNNIASLTNL